MFKKRRKLSKHNYPVEGFFLSCSTSLYLVYYMFIKFFIFVKSTLHTQFNLLWFTFYISLALSIFRMGKKGNAFIKTFTKEFCSVLFFFFSVSHFLFKLMEEEKAFDRSLLNILWLSCEYKRENGNSSKKCNCKMEITFCVVATFSHNDVQHSKFDLFSWLLYIYFFVIFY